MESVMSIFGIGERSLSKEWFAENIRKYESNMYGLAMTMMKNPDDSADAVQNAIVIAYSQLNTLRNPDRFKAWILQILVNECRKMLRSRNDTDSDEELEKMPAYSSDDLSMETKMTLNDAVMHLSEPYRTVIRLFYYEDMSIKEIEQITGSSSAAVRKQLQRGREMLKDQLGKDGI